MTPERKLWLDNIKIGDEVCVDESVIGGNNRKSITTITKITPTRKFHVHSTNGSVKSVSGKKVC